MLTAAERLKQANTEESFTTKSEVRKMLYRIYTEDIYRDRVERICNGSFVTGFTLFTADGYYNGNKEKSLVVEYVGESDAETRTLVDFVAKQICHALKQKCVLVQALKNTSWLVREGGMIEAENTVLQEA